jgi:hypothetical protein
MYAPGYGFRDLLSCRRMAPGGVRQVACGEHYLVGGVWLVPGGRV